MQYNYNFLCVQAFTLEFGVAVLTAVFTLLTVLVAVINAAKLSEATTVFATLVLLLLTWIIAFVGAFLRSRIVVCFAIVLWIIFMCTWLFMSMNQVLAQKFSYCVYDTKGMRCPPSMWIMTEGGGSAGEKDENETSTEEGGTDPPDEEERRIMWWKTDLTGQKATVKVFRQTTKNTLMTIVTATPASETDVSNKLGLTMPGVNSGCGCEHHPRTTIESPPSDLVTRVFVYRKNMRMYRQSAEVQWQKKKEGEIKKEYPTSSTISYKGVRDNQFLDEESEDETSEDSSNDSTTEDPNSGGDAETSLMSHILMIVFWALFVYALYTMLAYQDEIRLMRFRRETERNSISWSVS